MITLILPGNKIGTIRKHAFCTAVFKTLQNKVACSHFGSVVTGAAALELHECRAADNDADMRITCPLPNDVVRIRSAGIGFIPSSSRWQCDRIQYKCPLSKHILHDILTTSNGHFYLWQKIFESIQCPATTEGPSGMTRMNKVTYDCVKRK